MNWYSAFFSRNRNQEETEKVRSQRATSLTWAIMAIILNESTFRSIFLKNDLSDLSPHINLLNIDPFSHIGPDVVSTI